MWILFAINGNYYILLVYPCIYAKYIDVYEFISFSSYAMNRHIKMCIGVCVCVYTRLLHLIIIPVLNIVLLFK